MNSDDTYKKVISDLKKYSSEIWIGRIVWFTITTELDVNYSDFHKSILSTFNGLDVQPDLPTYPKAADIFNRACTNAQRKNIPSQDETCNNYLLRPAGSDDNSIWRTLVRETVDKKGHRLNYEEMISAVFNRTDDKVVFRLLHEPDFDQMKDPVLKIICDDILKYVDEQANKMTVWAVNDCVRRFIMHKMQGVMLRKGVYFVNECYAPSINALDSMLNSLGKGISFHYHPLIDDEKQRQMIKDSFEAESLEDISELLGSMSEIIKEKKTSGTRITSKRFAAFQSEFARLKERLTTYSEILSDSFNDASTQLDIMENVLIELMGCIKI